LHVGVRNPGEVVLLWEVLPHEAVSVLVQASFPAGIRMRKVDRRAQRRSDLFVLAKLLAVVDGDGMYPSEILMSFTSVAALVWSLCKRVSFDFRSTRLRMPPW